MNIRKIEHNDVHELLELYRHYVSEENLPGLSEQTMDSIWNTITLNPCINYFVLEQDDKLISSCILTITPSFIRGGNAFGFIEHVVVHKDHRLKGFAQTMLEYALNYAWEHDCTEVMLLSGSHNSNAHKLYQKLNFDPDRKKGFIIFKP